MNRLLVERATHPHALNNITEKMGDDWKVHALNTEGGEIADGQHARGHTIKRDKSFFEDNRHILFVSDEEKLPNTPRRQPDRHNPRSASAQPIRRLEEGRKAGGLRALAAERRHARVRHAVSDGLWRLQVRRRRTPLRVRPSGVAPRLGGTPQTIRDPAHEHGNIHSSELRFSTLLQTAYRIARLLSGCGWAGEESGVCTTS